MSDSTKDLVTSLHKQIEEKSKRLLNCEIEFHTTLKQLKEEVAFILMQNALLEEKMIKLLKEKSDLSKELLELKKQGNPNFNSDSKPSQDGNDSDSKASLELNRFKEIILNFLQTIDKLLNSTPNKPNEKGENKSNIQNKGKIKKKVDPSYLEKKFKEIENLIAFYDKNYKDHNSTKRKSNVNEIFEFLNSMDLSSHDGKEQIKFYNKKTAEFNSKYRENLRFLCTEDHNMLLKSLEEYDNENKSLRECINNLKNQDNNKLGKSIERGRSQNKEKKVKGCCDMKNQQNKEYLKYAYMKIKSMKSLREEINNVKPETIQLTEGRYSDYNENNKKILTSKDLRLQSAKRRQKTIESINKKIEEYNN